MWREMTKQDVAAYLNQDEIDMYCQLPDFKSQADPIGDLLKIVASKVRGKCRLNGKVRIDANHRYTIPETLLDSAMKMVRYRILTRLPMEVIEDRRNENQAAERELDDIARGEGTKPESYNEDGSDGDDVNLEAVPMCGFSIPPEFRLRGDNSGGRGGIGLRG